jgi:lipopolysaccharide export system protein LptA
VRTRKAELGILAAALAFAAVLVFSFRSGGRPGHGRGTRGALPAPGEGLRGQATTLLDGFDFTEESGGKPILRIKADRTVGYGPAAGLPPDLYAGEKVQLTVYPDEGSPVVVHADRGTYDERSREAHLSGNVHWIDAHGAMAETSEGFFRPASRTLDAPKKVHFTRGSIDLTAPSARYDLREKALALAGPVEGSGSGADSAGLSRMTARSGVYRREAGVLELEGVDGSSKAGDRYAADHVTVKTGEHGGAEWIRGVGNVHGILAPGRGTAAEGESSSVERQYAGDESLLGFDTEGKARSLSFTGKPALLLEPKRRLMAPKIDLAFQEGRLVSARAEGGVRIDGENGRADADRATVGFSPTGASQNLVLEGSVRVHAGERRGDADRAVELDPTGLWLLTGDAGRAARVESGSSKLSAERIELDRPRNQVRGQGRARAVLGGGGPARPTVTFVGDPKKPSYGKADRIVLDDAAQTATLSGSASVWQDDSSLFADDITLSDAQKTVTAVQNVRAVMAPDKTAKSGERGASVVTAKRLVYHENERSGRFDGGVTVTRGAGWRASGGESTAWLGKDRGIDCMEISGDVDLADRSVGRTAKAEKAVDYPKQGKTLLWGSPARVTSATGNQAAGAILTIFDRGDRVEITAPEGGKTETIHRTEKN